MNAKNWKVREYQQDTPKKPNSPNLSTYLFGNILWTLLKVVKVEKPLAK